MKMPRGGGIPPRMFLKLHYFEEIDLNTDGALPFSVIGRVYNMNSLFDPDAAAGGHQPHYFDQFSPLYTIYMVYGVKVMARYLSVTATSTATANLHCMLIPFKYGEAATSSTLSAINWTGVMERYQGTRWGMLRSDTNPMKTLKAFWKIKTLKGRRLDEDDDAALVTANPVAPCRFAFAITNVQSTASRTVRVGFHITYYAKLYARALVGES